jgi:hypothetical protein
MGNSVPQNRSALKKSRSLREYTRGSSLITSCISNRRSISLSRAQFMAPNDAEIIDIPTLRCQTSTINMNKKDRSKQLDYIHSCVRKDKGLFGKYLKSLSLKINRSI